MPERAEPRPISIWQPRTENGVVVFERPAAGPFGDHYADRPRIPADKPSGVRRVLLFGESAAAGYLYAPAATPAKRLAGRLASGPAAPVEVIDLARTDERLATLIETVERSLQLGPDLLVVFAGNNWPLLECPAWSPYARDPAARRRYGEALADAGLWGPIQTAARQVLERAAAGLARVAHLAGRAGVPVVLVVPEVNLADWSSRQPVPWLPGDGVRPWYAALRRGLAALARADADAALAHAAAMQQRDDGLCPTAFRIRAEALGLRGDDAAAALAARDEVAARHHPMLAFLAAPQATPMVQALLRRAATAHGFDLVDLPWAFARHTGSPLAGGRLFLDYCHLSAEGIALAAEAMASAVEARLAPGSRTASAPLVTREAPSEVEASARFGAAVHGAHRLAAVAPRRALLRRQCDLALAATPAVAEVMVALVEARTSGLPAVLSDGQARLAASGLPFGLQHGWRYPHLDAEVIEVARAALAEAGHDDAVAALDRAVARVAVETIGPVDLAAGGFFLDQPLEQLFPAVMPGGETTPRAFLRFAWPTTTFAFAALGDRDLRCRIDARLPRQNGLPPARPRAVAAVELAGATIGALALAPAWQRTELKLPAARLAAGINRLTVRWPMPAERGEDVLRAAVARLRDGVEADVHPIFGEVFTARLMPD